MTKETLILLSAKQTIYAENYTGKTGVKDNPFKLGSVNEVHPVAHRLKLKPEDEFSNSFRYIYTRSEKYGDEEGFLSTYHQNYQMDINFIDLSTYEELKAREELTLEIIESLSLNIKEQENKFFAAREEYIKYLSDLGYVEEEISDYDRDTEYYMVHPLYLAQWRKDAWKPNDKYPSWAVKEIGFFASK